MLAFYREGSRPAILVHDPAHAEPPPGVPRGTGLWVYDLDPRVADWCWVPGERLVPVQDAAAVEDARARYLGREAAKEERARAEAERRAREEEAESRRLVEQANRDRRRDERRRKEAEARAAHRGLVRAAAERHRDSRTEAGSLVALEIEHQLRWHPALYDPATRVQGGVSLFSPAHPDGPVLWLAGVENPRHRPDVRSLGGKGARTGLVDRYIQWRERERALHRDAERRAEAAARRRRLDAAVRNAERMLASAAPLLGPHGIRAEAEDFAIALTWCADWADARECQQARFRRSGNSVRGFARGLRRRAARLRDEDKEDPCLPFDRYLAQKLSARLAEKAARGFYESRDPALAGPDGTRREVEDVSILQDTGDPRFSREFDLRYPEPAEGPRKHVDVKNTRRDRRDRLGYSHHRVNKMRRLDDDSPVVITGVLSDWLRLPDLLAEEGVPSAEILGETDRDRLQALEAEFSLGKLRVDLRGHAGAEYMLPPWMFEVPPFADAERRAAMDALREAFASLGEMEPAVPPAIPLCLAAGIGPDGAEWNRLPAHVRALAEGWRSDARAGRLSLPRLYLSVLRAFFQRVEARDGGLFDTRAVADVLYHGPLPTAGEPDLRPPLGIRDPLACVRNLLDTLELLQSSGLDPLRAFQSFEFRGAGELYGKLPGEAGVTEWTLMFPYCGSSSCVHTRLQLGIETPCPVCRKLACSKCGYCTKNCSGIRSPDARADAAPPWMVTPGRAHAPRG